MEQFKLIFSCLVMLFLVVILRVCNASIVDSTFAGKVSGRVRVGVTGRVREGTVLRSREGVVGRGREGLTGRLLQGVTGRLCHLNHKSALLMQT